LKALIEYLTPGFGVAVGPPGVTMRKKPPIVVSSSTPVEFALRVKIN
jgi:hypothetical protein